MIWAFGPIKQITHRHIIDLVKEHVCNLPKSSTDILTFNLEGLVMTREEKRIGNLFYSHIIEYGLEVNYLIEPHDEETMYNAINNMVMAIHIAILSGESFKGIRYLNPVERFEPLHYSPHQIANLVLGYEMFIPRLIEYIIMGDMQIIDGYSVCMRFKGQMDKKLVVEMYYMAMLDFVTDIYARRCLTEFIGCYYVELEGMFLAIKFRMEPLRCREYSENPFEHIHKHITSSRVRRMDHKGFYLYSPSTKYAETGIPSK